MKLWFLLLPMFGFAVEERIAIVMPDQFPTATVGKNRAIPFRPTMEQINSIEKKLEVYLKSNQPMVFKKYKKYYRQYTGLEVVSESKTVRANFLCHVEGDRWRKEWIMVLDGGDCYFNFSFDLEKSEIKDFTVHRNS